MHANFCSVEPVKVVFAVEPADVGIEQKQYDWSDSVLAARTLLDCSEEA